MRSRRMLSVLAFGLVALGVSRFVSARGRSGAAGVAGPSTYVTAPATAAEIDAASPPASAGAEASSTSPNARVRVIARGRIDAGRLAALQVEVVERRGNGQWVLLVPADRLDALFSLPGDFTTRVSTPANTL
ncbi:MAG: hypothetical protein U0167_06380 [bacterium]